MRAVMGILLAALAACSAEAPAPPALVSVRYASYEDCILNKLGRGQSTVASEAIIEACRSKYPEQEEVAEDVPEARRSSGTRSYHGYACTDDCSGHLAGFRWAESKGITDASYCGGSSQSFTEGCIAYTTQIPKD